MHIIYYANKFVNYTRKYGFIETTKSVPLFIKKKLRIYPYEKPYDSTYETDSYEGINAVNNLDIKPIAFYLPQYHEIPENNQWWGEGFTEWTNTKKAVPKYEGHYQPRNPHEDFGYYDLTDVEVLKKQVALAKQHGIYGFCIYYYWFSGKRLLERPLDILLEYKEIDMPFFVCWANENWTRTWSGNTENILIEQKHKKDDAENFIKDIKKYVIDDRYIRVDDKPVIIIYNPSEIPSVEVFLDDLRKYAIKEGIGEIELWVCETNKDAVDSLALNNKVEALIEFPPRSIDFDKEILIKHLSYRDDGACIYDYPRLVKLACKKYRKIRTNIYYFPTCMLAWDNSPRKEKEWHSFYGFSTNAFYKWVKNMIKMVRDKYPVDRRFIFINAWNEWGEGAYLEPDEKYGYANINTFSRAIIDN